MATIRHNYYHNASRQRTGTAEGYKHILPSNSVDYTEGLGSSLYPNQPITDASGAQRDPSTGRTWQINRGRGFVGNPVLPETMQLKHIYNPFVQQSLDLMSAADSYVRRRQGGFVRSTRGDDILYMKKQPELAKRLQWLTLLRNNNIASQPYFNV